MGHEGKVGTQETPPSGQMAVGTEAMVPDPAMHGELLESMRGFLEELEEGSQVADLRMNTPRKADQQTGLKKEDQGTGVHPQVSLARSGAEPSTEEVRRSGLRLLGLLEAGEEIDPLALGRLETWLGLPRLQENGE